MTIILSLLEQLRQLDARLTVQDGNLRIQSPRGPLPPVLREQLVAHKQELIVALGGGDPVAEDVDADTDATIVPVDRSGPVPLSFAQQRMWTLDQLGADGATYAIHMGLRLQGAVDIAAMASALDTLVNRHDILRSRYIAVDGQPMQVVDASGSCPFEAIAIDAADLDARLAQQAALPFDLAAGPLFSAVLFTLGAQDHVLSLRMHHIVADGWSAGILLRELTQAYHAHAAAEPLLLPALPLQYGDFAVWQRGRVDDARLAAQLDYWRGHLAGAPDGLDLPTDGQRGPLQTYAGDLHAHPLPAALGPAVIQLARAYGCTPYVVLLAAFAVLLARLARQDDVVIGVPLAGRERRELAGLVGYFVNTQALRFALDMREPFEAVLRRAVRAVADAQANQDVPFEQVVDALQVSRRPGQTPLFQVMFDLEAGADPVQPAPGGTGLRVAPVRSPHTVAKFDLTLNMVQRGTTFSAQLEYNTDLFQATTIAGWVQAFDTLLMAAIAAPATALADLPLQSSGDVARRVQASEGPRRLLQGDVVARFRARAAACPDAVALDGPAGRWSYAELERRSAHLASRLAAAGLAPGACVALSFRRSIEQIAAALAVLRAGLCYVPLDPALPDERAAFLVEDSGAALLLTHAGLHPDAQLPTWRLDGSWWDAAAAAGAPIDLPVHPLQSAYVIYTSGSTGRPKGVRIGHHALLNHAEAMATLFELSPQDRALQFSTFSFDMAVEEIFPTLLAGATLVLYDDRLGLDVEAFEGYLSRERITIANLPTAYWHLWTHALHGADAALPALRLVIVGGEAPAFECLQRWRQCRPSVRWLNTYGPTETTVSASWWEGSACDLERLHSRILPIGVALPNSALRVLDGALQPVLPGTSGELHVSGVNLALGYVGQPVLTALAFVPDPHATEPGARMYRTGDLVRYGADGQLDYVGRADHQVKVRGFRIELGEVEIGLRGCAGVRDAVVVARADAGGGYRLDGYVAGEALQAETLRSELTARLPAYMVPARLCVLEALPLTPNGKVDRKALPLLEAVAEEVVAPDGPLEQQLQVIWGQLLEQPQIGVTANFFHSGGHSLLAVQLMSRVREAFGVSLPLSLVYRAPTIRAFASAMHSPASATMVVPLNRAHDRPVVFAIHAAAGDIGRYRALAEALDGSVDVHAIQRPENLGDTPVELIPIDVLAQKYVRQMRTVQPHGPYRLMGWSLGGLIAIDVIRELEKQGERAALLVTIDTVFPGQETRDFVSNWVNGQPWKWVLESIADDKGVMDVLDEAIGFSHDGILDAMKGRFRALAAANLLAVLDQRTDGTIQPDFHLRIIAERTAETMDMDLQTAMTGRLVDPVGSRVMRVRADHFSVIDHPAVAEACAEVTSATA